VIVDRTLGRDDFPFPLDRPLTGQDLLQVLPGVLRPLWSQAANAVRGDAATVTALLTGPNRVRLDDGDGGTYAARYLAGYSPTVGDTVLVLRNSAKAIVLGPLA
jgi:hypothetical protein